MDERKAFSLFSFDLTLFIVCGLLFLGNIYNAEWLWVGVFGIGTLVMGVGSYCSYSIYKSTQKTGVWEVKGNDKRKVSIF